MYTKWLVLADYVILRFTFVCCVHVCVTGGQWKYTSPQRQSYVSEPQSKLDAIDSTPLRTFSHSLWSQCACVRIKVISRIHNFDVGLANDVSTKKVWCWHLLFDLVMLVDDTWQCTPSENVLSREILQRIVICVWLWKFPEQSSLTTWIYIDRRVT